MTLPPSGLIYNEYYLYANKQWEVVPSGSMSYTLASGVLQNAPVIVTSSGYTTTTPAEPWGQIGGSGRWDKKGHGFFTVTPAGVYNTNFQEFTMNPAAEGKIEFNQALEVPVIVEYEAHPSGYYNVSNINVNPVMRETDSGFLQITSIGEPTHLSLKATQSVLKGDGYHSANLIATLYDQNLNRINDKKIIFEMLFDLNAYSGPNTDTGYLVPGKDDGEIYGVHPSGFVYETLAYTDTFGQASAKCNTFVNKDGWMVFKAYYAEASGVFDTTEILAYSWKSGLFILDYSMLDSLDYLGDVAWSASGIPGSDPAD